jgi:hypothetical protein
MIRRLAPLAGMLLLSGCVWFNEQGIHTGMSAPTLATGLAHLEVISLSNTRKTLGDHVATWVTGKDCSTVRAQLGEGAWCVDWPGPPPPPQQVYCYSSLGKPSCFAQPYNEGNDRLIGFVPASPPIR